MTIKAFITKLISLFSKAAAPAIAPTTIIKIKFSDKVVGVIQSIDIKELKDKPPKITASRTRFNRLVLEEIFSRGYVHKAAQKFPFQIEIQDDQMITTIQNAWIEDISYSYQTNDWVIVEEMKLEAEEIKSYKF